MSSETDASAGLPSDLSEADVRAQLGRILESDVFSRSRQLRRFLSFVVEESLAGHGRSLKESVLAHELYGKGTDFDGGTDPVVRVDARRLRDKLREYYAGRSDPIVISLPKGSYAPVFGAAFPAHRPSTEQVVAPEAPQMPPVTTISRPRNVAGIVAVVIGIAVAVFAWYSRRTPANAPALLLPLASYPGIEGPPALSPDGELVAFAWTGNTGTDQTDIYVKAVNSEALRQLTATLSSETYPAWSPDGRSIAFVRDGNGVFTMSQLGGDERQASASGTHVGWADDSKSVLIRDRDTETAPFGIYQVFLDTLERRRLTQAPVGAGDWRFEVSPDGETLAFIRYEKVGIADLFVVPLRGGEPRRLSNWNAPLTGLSWTPDGREIVYSVDQPAASRLWRINANATTPGRGSPLPDITAAASNPSISRPAPGRPARVAFQTITQDVDLQMMDLEAPVVNDAIEPRPFASSTRIEGSSRFSPDGSRIAFMSIRSGVRELWIAARDGTAVQQITSLDAAGILVGDWAPDGTRVAFEAAVDGNSDVYVVGTDGRQLRRLTTESSIDGVPSWSRDGKWIYFASTRAGAIPDVWRIAADGGPAHRLTHTGGFEPRESPDGQHLYFLDRAPGGRLMTVTARLMRVPVVGGPEEQLLDGIRPFLWAVTDAGIVFVTREADFDAIDVYRFSDQRVSRIGRLTFRIPGTFSHMSVSRDGRWALATKMERFDSDLMRLDNFR